MLERESFESGWQVSLRPKGAGRFLGAAFMGFWLCGWAVGEVFAGGTLLAGLRDLFAPDLAVPWLPHMKNAAPENPWPVLAFLSFWLTFWTFGGLMAMNEFVRSLAGVDHVRWDHEGLEVLRRAGPFASRRRIAWSETTELHTQRRGRIVAHTRKGLSTVTGFGSAEERRELAGFLEAAWREARGGESEARLATTSTPAGWVAERGDDGREILASHAGNRRVGGIVLGVIALGLGLAAASFTRAGGPGAWIGVGVFGVLALFAMTGVAWLVLGRVEIRPGPGSLQRVKRFLGRDWSREVSPARLRLENGRDSDGDERWELVASGPGGRLSLATELHAPGSARHMGLWLAQRMNVELEGLPGAEREEGRRAG